MSGLTVGLLGMDTQELQLKAHSSNRLERQWAATLNSVTADHHRLLITLLLANTFCLECLPVVLEEVLSPESAILFSVVGVLLFGEVIPMAVLTGPHKFELAAKLVPAVKVFLCVLLPLAWPMAKLLDWIVGKHVAKSLGRQQLKALILLSADGGGHASERTPQLALSMTPEEGALAVNALDFGTKTASTCARGLNEVFMLEDSAPLDAALLAQVREQGYSRIPIFSGGRDCITGVLLAKALVGIAPCPEQSLIEWVTSATSGDGASPWRLPVAVPHTLPLPQLLRELRNNEGGCHLAVVVEPVSCESPSEWKRAMDKVLGIVTIHDVLEELLQAQIEDEFDFHRAGSGNIAVVTPRIGRLQRLASPIFPVSPESEEESILLGRRME